MSRLAVMGLALVLLLVALPLISLGTYQDIPAAWWAGLAALALGGLVPPVSRYALPEEDEEG